MSGPTMREAEVVVIGAGIVGLSIAFELTRRGRRVLVVERQTLGSGATWAAGGMLAPVSETEFETEELHGFARDSLQRYPEFVAEVERVTGISCGYRSEGTLWVALNRDDLAELRHLAETLAGRGLSALPLAAEAVLDREPHLSGRVVGGLYVADDHQVDPRALSRGLEQAITQQGAELRRGVTVQKIEPLAGGGLRLSTSAGRIVAPQVVVAAGAWATRDIELPLARLGLRPVKGQLLRLRGAPLLRHVVRTPEAYLVPRSSGELLVGATMEEMGFDTSATAGAAMDLLRHAWQALPGIYDLELVECSVGLRSAVDDHLPVIGESAEAGLFLAFGHFRHGVLLAPATAWYLARWLDEGRMPAEIDAFIPARLAAVGESAGG